MENSIASINGHQKSRILITGGSGFIGTNLIEYYKNSDFEIMNLDIKAPKLDGHIKYWNNVDILNSELLYETVSNFQPEYVVHLAAKTDLDGKTIDSYSANTAGVKNLLVALNKTESLIKVIIASSKFVCANGYEPKSQYDYCPHTIYGESKVITEKITWEYRPESDWCIVRPTSIWGPWFGEPYLNFFKLISKGLYFHIGKKKCYKTYGYIGNCIHQIDALLFSSTKNENDKVFYLGDWEPYEVSEWAEEIATELKMKIPRIPRVVIRAAAYVGDFLRFFRIKFPITSFRYTNMTTDGINSIKKTIQFVPKLPYSRKDGTRETLKWLKYK